MIIPALTLLISAPIGTQVAVVYDTGLNQEIRPVLEGLEAVVAEAGPVTFTLVHCDPSKDSIELQPNLDQIYPNLMIMDRRPGRENCAASVDVVAAAVDRVKWKEGWRRRILVVGRQRAVISAGKESPESLMNRAARADIVVHGIELVTWFVGTSIAGVERDLERFLNHPTRPLGRDFTYPRHATLASGGAFFIVRSPRAARRWYGARRLRQGIDLSRAYAPKNDRLAALANGQIRTTEITADQVPPPLSGIDLEPLLDAVWDFVDARETARRLNDQKFEDRRRETGTLAGKALLKKRRLPPSRR